MRNRLSKMNKVYLHTSNSFGHVLISAVCATAFFLLTSCTNCNCLFLTDESGNVFSQMDGFVVKRGDTYGKFSNIKSSVLNSDD